MFEVTDKELKEIIKATLFVSGEGIELIEFTEKFNRTAEQINALINELKEELSNANGIHLITYANKVQLSSNPSYAEAIATILNPIREKSLTKAVMQTLGIIAYKQPITRLEIESIRGVSSDYAVQVLSDNNLIEVVGRKDVVGKPLLFGTTEEFLKRFDLQNVSSLPDYEELLERIKLIREENANKNPDNLYKDFEIKDEELTDYMEEQKVLSEDDMRKKQERDEILVSKLKDIDKVIRHAKVNKETPGQEQHKETDEHMSGEEIESLFSKIIGSKKEDEKSENIAN